MHLAILLEEESMEAVVISILNRVMDENAPHSWQTHPYSGKNDLLKKLPNLLSAYAGAWFQQTYPEHAILVIIDQDQDDCRELKQRILDMGQRAGLDKRLVVRIAVTELEAWFLGDPAALEATFPKLTKRRLGRRAAYRNPDERPRPSEDLEREMKAAS